MKIYPYAVGRTYRYRQSQRQRFEKKLDSSRWVELANHPILDDVLALQEKEEKYLADCQRVLDEFNGGTPLTAFGRKDRLRIKYYQKHGCFPPLVVL